MTGQSRTEDVLRESEGRLHAIVDNVVDGVITINEGRIVQSFNLAAERIFGYSSDEVIGKNVKMLMPEPYHSQHDGYVGNYLRTGKAKVIGIGREVVGRRKDGSTFPLDLAVSEVRLGEERLFTGIIRDITERKQAEEQIRKLSHAVEQSPSVVMIVGTDGNVQYVNPKFTQITGYVPEEIIGQNPRMMQSGEKSPEEYKELWDAITSGKEWRGEFHNKKKNGELYWEAASISPVKDAKGVTTHYIKVSEDVTKRKRAEEKIKYMAYHDALTGLSNRKHFMERLDQGLVHARRTGRMLAVIFLDLDRFKTINDTLGHDMGDLLLQSTAGRLKNCVRKEDTVARQGGDEFTLLIAEVSHVKDAVGIADKILESIKQPYMLEGHELFITTSIGVAFFPDDGEDAETLLKNADVAMYRAKDEGRNGYQLYTPAMQANALEKLELENSLRRAMERNELTVYYQPQVSLKTGEIVGVEALARWRHNEKGMLPAMEFIPLAEDIGLIVPIGEWVLRTACEQNRAWQGAGLPPIRMAVNLSVLMFQQKGLVDVVNGVLKETGLAPEFLELEVTETVLMKDFAAAATTLITLKDMGVHVAIDDFGTGYSSLSYLKRLSVDRLKIDGSFVRDLTIHPDDDAIVTATVAMAHSLKLSALAEGVETRPQLEFLRSVQCDDMQGNLFSKPLPPEEFEGLLKGGKGLQVERE